MTKSADTGQDSGAADRSADLGRIAAELLQNSPLLSMNPMMAQPAAAMAAATALGLSMTTQMAGAFFGALQGALDVGNRLAASVDTHMDPVRPTPTRSPVAMTSVEARPVAKAPTIVKAPATAKAKTVKAKPVVAAKPAKAAAGNKKAGVKADDLKRISGIGPKLEQVLNQRGIYVFADIAGWTEADVAQIDAELGFEGRIVRDDWVGQARLLAPKPSRRNKLTVG